MLAIEEIFFNIKANNFAHLISLVAPTLFAKKYINRGFLEAIISREKQFPTGLSFGGFNVAIPHTNATYVAKSGIIAIKLKNPILMTHMATTNQRLKVCFLFILLVKESKLQVGVLTELINHFKNQATQKKLANSQTKQEMFAIFKK